MQLLQPAGSSPSKSAQFLDGIPHALYKGVGLARQIFFSIDESGTLTRARYLGGARDSSKLARHTLTIGMADPLTRRLAESGTAWWRGIADEVPLTDLPSEWRVTGNSEGFFASMIRTADGRGALLYCDANKGSMLLSEERFNQFREICELLSLKLAGPIPEPIEPTASTGPTEPSKPVYP